MDHTSITVHLQSMHSASQATAAQLIHAGTGGVYCKVGGQETRGHPQANAQPSITASALEEMYCNAMIGRHGGIFDVPPEHAQIMSTFIHERLDVLNELKAVVVSVSPDSASQKVATEALAGIRAAGMDRSRVHLLLTDAPENGDIEHLYLTVLEFAREAQIKVSADARLTASPLFEKLHQLQLPVAAMLNRIVDYDAELVTARINDAPEKIRLALALKVLAQRSLLATAGDYERVVDALGLPRISKEDWRAESNASRKRSHQPAIK